MANASNTAWDVNQVAEKLKSNDQSQLDKVAKAQVNETELPSTLTELEAIARGNISFKSGLFGGKSANKNFVDPKKVTTPAALQGKKNQGTLPQSSDASSKLVKLALPVFTTGTTDAGVAKDVYGDSLNSIQTNARSILSDVFDAVNTGLSGVLKASLGQTVQSINLVSNITDPKVADGILGQFKNSLLNGVPLTNDSIKNTLYNAIGYSGKSDNFLDAVKGIGRQTLDDIVKGVDGQSGLITLYKGFEVVINGDFNTADSVFKIITNITNNTALGNFLNIGDQMKIISAVTKTLYNLGVPELFEDIYNSITHSNKEHYITDNINGGLNAGDLDFLEFSLKYKSGEWILANYPNAIRVLVSSYTPTKNKEGGVDASEYQRFLNVLSQIDPEWWVATIENNVRIANLNVFSEFNNHARLAMLQAANPDLICSLLVSENYGTVFNTLKEVQSRYPLYPIA